MNSGLLISAINNRDLTQTRQRRALGIPKREIDWTRNRSNRPKVISPEVVSPETRVKSPTVLSHVARILSGKMHRETKLIFVKKRVYVIYLVL